MKKLKRIIASASAAAMAASALLAAVPASALTNGESTSRISKIKEIFPKRFL